MCSVCAFSGLEENHKILNCASEKTFSINRWFIVFIQKFLIKVGMWKVNRLWWSEGVLILSHCHFAVSPIDTKRLSRGYIEAFQMSRARYNFSRWIWDEKCFFAQTGAEKCFLKLKRLSLICCFNNEVKIESKTRRIFINVRDLKCFMENEDWRRPSQVNRNFPVTSFHEARRCQSWGISFT